MKFNLTPAAMQDFQAMVYTFSRPQIKYIKKAHCEEMENLIRKR